jgi:hypothetical protein
MAEAKPVHAARRIVPTLAPKVTSLSPLRLVGRWGLHEDFIDSSYVHYTSLLQPQVSRLRVDYKQIGGKPDFVSHEHPRSSKNGVACMIHRRNAASDRGGSQQLLPAGQQHRRRAHGAMATWRRAGLLLAYCIHTLLLCGMPSVRGGFCFLCWRTL